MDPSHTMDMEMSPLDNDTVHSLIPRVKLPDVVRKKSSLSPKPMPSDLGYDAKQPRQPTVVPSTDPILTKASERISETSESSSGPSVPSKQESREDSHSVQRTSTESTESRSKTYSIAELVELGYRSRRLSRSELRLSDEAPIGKNQFCFDPLRRVPLRASPL